ncbi:NMUR1 [Mytilus coruscus]|uniref:NMUR1 n=1 Tax=Mytilus coruscus TaxID=42192 RepID=A0A6J8EYM7_MYTCO|nr:NMUR1 [Mytilus coruscus]
MMYLNSTSTAIYTISENDTHEYTSILEISNQLARVLIPAAVFFCIILVSGVIGNIMVLIVYGFRIKKTAYSILILILAALDLMTCLLGVPYHIVSVVYPLMFVWNGFCKSVSFILHFTTMSSAFIVNIIAYDRYRKICRPFQSQLSLTRIKRDSFFVITVSVILATPVLVIYGSTAEETDIANLTGTVCFIRQEFSGTLFHQIYDGIIFLLFIVLLIFMISMYINVGRRILKLRALKRKTSNSASETAATRESKDWNTIKMLQKKTQGEENATTISMAPKRNNQDNSYRSSEKLTHCKIKTD